MSGIELDTNQHRSRQMFFQMAARRDPMADVNAFLERVEAARRRPMTPDEARRVVESAFGSGRRTGGPSLVVTRQDLEARIRSRLPSPSRQVDRGASDLATREGVAENVTPRTQRLTAGQRSFLKDQLRRRGLPTSHIDDIRFVSGLDSHANVPSRIAYNSGVKAVTQGSTVYVRPEYFDEVANFRSLTGFEEAYHTAQAVGDASFYPSYLTSSVGGLLSSGDGYNGNVYEAFAHGAARQMFRDYHAQPSHR